MKNIKNKIMNYTWNSIRNSTRDHTITLVSISLYGSISGSIWITDPSTTRHSINDIIKSYIR